MVPKGAAAESVRHAPCHSPSLHLKRFLQRSHFRLAMVCLGVVLLIALVGMAYIVDAQAEQGHGELKVGTIRGRLALRMLQRHRLQRI